MVTCMPPTFDELEKFSSDARGGDVSSLSTPFTNRKRGPFMKGDRVTFVKGDLRNLKGSVEKVDGDTVHIKPSEKGLPENLAISGKEICKYFESGNHVKVVSGSAEGATGMVVSVEDHVVNIVSDTTKELLRVFTDNVVESSEVTSGIIRLGDYEVHGLVLLDDNSFGVVIRIESEAFQVLKGVPGRPYVALVRLQQIKYKIDMKCFAKDRYMNTSSVKDVVKIVEGPYRVRFSTDTLQHLALDFVVVKIKHASPCSFYPLFLMRTNFSCLKGNRVLPLKSLCFFFL